MSPPSSAEEPAAAVLFLGGILMVSLMKMQSEVVENERLATVKRPAVNVCAGVVVGVWCRWRK